MNVPDTPGQASGLIVKTTRLPDDAEPGPASIETRHVIIGQDACDG